MAGKIKIDFYIHYFSVSVMKHHDRSNFQKGRDYFHLWFQEVWVHNGGDSVAAHITTVTGSRAVTTSAVSMNQKGNTREGWTLKSPCFQPLTSASIGLLKEHHKLVTNSSNTQIHTGTLTFKSSQLQKQI